MIGDIYLGYMIGRIDSYTILILDCRNFLGLPLGLKDFSIYIRPGNIITLVFIR